MCSMFLPEISSFVSAMLFAVHPIHTEAVTGVVGRAETLSSVFFLAAFILYAKSTKRKRFTGWRWLVFSMLAVATAMLCKEQGITITGICAVYELFVAQKVCFRQPTTYDCMSPWSVPTDTKMCLIINFGAIANLFAINL
ncbi:Protein O-mannosyl-transferase tmtc3 [Homalodisca vitripennis]|nr:Protein O-mannosyl-transferase tmtc3 [Homalodisca vitripennis]